MPESITQGTQETELTSSQMHQSLGVWGDRKSFHRLLIRYGFAKSIFIITALCTLCAVLFATLVWQYVFDQAYNPYVPITASLVTLVVCPIFASYIVSTAIDLHHLESHLRHLVSYDTLTEVLTRRLFLVNAERLYAIAKRTNKSFTVAYIDLDNFKSINDRYGHAAGDEVLRQCAELLKSELRQSDIVGRIGGEEFAICLLDTDIKGAEHLLNQMRMLVKSLTVKTEHGQTIQLTMSAGLRFVNTYPNVSLDTLIDQADKALYRAKTTGKDKVSVYEAA